MTSPVPDSGAPTGALPLRMGSEKDFARVRALFRDEGFEERSVCELLGIEDPSLIGRVDPATPRLAGAKSPALAVLVRLFLFLQALPRGDVERFIDASAREALLALDLLRPVDEARGGASYYAPVFLSPVAGFVVASDRHTNPDGSPAVAPSDAVFPAIWGGTLRFLRVIGKTDAAAALDLGAGSGIGAFVLSRRAQRVVAADITARATHFASFNAVLNECPNVEAREGDLYGAVTGQTFDRIVAHPPYVPSLDTAMIFRDAGETGEVLVKRIIEGLDRHLRPGGTLSIVCAGWDTDAGSFEARARGWLGPSDAEFDVIFAYTNELSPQQLATQLAGRRRGDDGGEFARWDDIFRRGGMRRLMYGALVMQRRVAGARGAGAPLTARVRLSASTDGASFEWALRWYDWLRATPVPAVMEALGGSRPRLSESLRVRVTHVPHGGMLVPAEFVLESDRPFFAETRVEPWMAAVLAQLDGEATATAVYAKARADIVIPESFEHGDFIAFLAKAIERGYVEVPTSILSHA